MLSVRLRLADAVSGGSGARFGEGPTLTARTALRRVTAAEFVEVALAGDAGGGAAGPAPQPPAGGGRPAETLLVLFQRDTPEDRRCARVLAEVAAAHADRVRALAVPAEDIRAQLDRWQKQRQSYDTYDFRRLPAVGVFRGGHLVTTFCPRLVFYDEHLQEREEREQLEIFLSKMVYFDPAAVKEQKNLELATGGSP